MLTTFPIMGDCSNTIKGSLTSAAQTLSDLGVSFPINGITITVESADARFSFSASATAALGHVLAVGQSLRIPSSFSCRRLNLVNRVSSADSVVMLTPER